MNQYEKNLLMQIALDAEYEIISFVNNSQLGTSYNATMNNEKLNNITQILIPAIYCIVAIVGLAGNGIILYIMAKLVKKKSVTDVYVTNLAIADILLLGTLPFWAADLIMDEWIFGHFMCKIASCMTYMNMYASVFFLTAMSLDRWLAVVKAIKCRDFRTVRNAWISAGVVWTLGLLFMILPFMYRTTKNIEPKRQKCTWQFPQNSSFSLNVTYNVLRTFVGFILPLIVILFCYIDLLRFMKKKSKIKKRKTDKRKDKVTKMVFVVISCFIVCWLPNQITNFINLLKLTNIIQFGCEKEIYTNPITYNTSTLHQELIAWNNTQPEMPVTVVPQENKLFNNSNNATALLMDWYKELNQFNTTITPSSESCYRTMLYIHLITVCLGFSNSMMNPLVYSFMGAMFRKKLQQVFTCASKKSEFHNNEPRQSFWTSLRYTTTTRIRTSTVNFGRKVNPVLGGASVMVVTADGAEDKAQPLSYHSKLPKSSLVGADHIQGDGLFSDPLDDDVSVKARRFSDAPVTKRKMRKVSTAAYYKNHDRKGITGVNEAVEMIKNADENLHKDFAYIDEQLITDVTKPLSNSVLNISIINGDCL